MNQNAYLAALEALARRITTSSFADTRDKAPAALDPEMIEIVDDARAALALEDEITLEANPHTNLLEALKAVAGWASDEGPLKGKSPGEVSDFARAALALAERGIR